MVYGYGVRKMVLVILKEVYNFFAMLLRMFNFYHISGSIFGEIISKYGLGVGANDGVLLGFVSKGNIGFLANGVHQQGFDVLLYGIEQGRAVKLRNAVMKRKSRVFKFEIEKFHAQFGCKYYSVIVGLHLFSNKQSAYFFTVNGNIGFEKKRSKIVAKDRLQRLCLLVGRR